MTKDQALAKAMQLCSLREYAASEIEDKLDKWGIAVSDRQIVIEHLRKEKYIDDFRLARYYTKDKLHFNKWGKIKIRIMLQQKGIHDEAIRSAFSELDMDEYYKILMEEIIKKRKTIKDEDEYTLKAKLIRFGTGRGFETDLVYRILEEIMDY